MRLNLSAWITALVIAATAATTIARAENPKGAEFKGYFPVNDLLVARLMKEKSGFALAGYLGEDCAGCSASLARLLGGYGGGGLDNRFRNGEPNVANMLLWHMALDGFSKDIGKLCAAQERGPLAALVNEAFASKVKTLCAWPAASAQSDDALFAYWEAIMAYDAPFSEFLEWKQFFLTSPYAQAPAAEAVAAMSMAIFYNPYFLLGE